MEFKADPVTPYWRLSGFYLFYFASLGALVPYWGVYLKSLNFSASDIGVIMAVIMATKIVSPNIWGWIADHTGKRMLVVRAASLAAALIFAAVLVNNSYWWLLGIMLGFSFFWNAALPQFEATTFNHLGSHTHRYSSIRLWGSVGFILAVWALGEWMGWLGLSRYPWVLLALFIGIWLFSLLVPERAAGHLPMDREPLSVVVRRPHVMGLLVACLLMQTSHGPYYGFYTLYLQGHHYSLQQIGLFWAIGVGAEVVVFLIMHRLVPLFGLRRLLLLSLLLASLRWLLVGLLPDNLGLVLFAQLLHAATFGIYHAVAIQLIHTYFTGQHQGKGQALYSSISFGLGGAIGSLYAGYSWEYLGPSSPFLIAAGISLAGAYVVLRYVEDSPSTSARMQQEPAQ